MNIFTKIINNIKITFKEHYKNIIFFYLVTIFSAIVTQIFIMNKNISIGFILFTVIFNAISFISLYTFIYTFFPNKK